MTVLSVLLLLGLCVFDGARAVNMNTAEWDAFQDLLSAVYTFTPSSTIITRYGVSTTTSSKTCESSTSKDARCNSAGRLTYLKIEASSGTRSIDFQWSSALAKFSQLSTLELRGTGVRGRLWLNRIWLNLQRLTLLGTDISGPLPDWAVEVPTLDVRNGNDNLNRVLPASVVTGPATACVLETSDFWVCPVPMWAETLCGLNATACLAATPAPTPAPTDAPTPRPTPADGECVASLVPCPDADNTTTIAAECATAGYVCQWSCCLISCTDSYANDDLDPEIDDNYSCARVLGAYDCGETPSDCQKSWAPPSSGGNHTLEIGFATAVHGEALVIVQNYYLGHVQQIEVYDEASRAWVSATFTVNTTTAPGDTVTKERFPLPANVKTKRVRIGMVALDDKNEVDGVFIIGKPLPPPPTPAPTPFTGPTPVPTPAPAPCLAPVEKVASSAQFDDTLADRLCIDTACQWVCLVNNCTDAIDDCKKTIGFDLMTTWITPASVPNTLDVSFGVGALATALVLLETQIGTGVTGIDVFLPSNSSFVTVYTAAVVPIGSGPEVYNFTVPVTEFVSRVRVRLDGYRAHRIQALRLVGKLAPRPTPAPTRPPQVATRRLPGQFQKTTAKLAAARRALLAQNNPAPVVGEVLYVPAGFTGGGFPAAVTVFDRCNLTRGLCASYTGDITSQSPAPEFDQPAAAALRVGSENVLMVQGGRGQYRITSTQRRAIGDLFWRTDTTPDWAKLPLVTPRRESCLVAVQASKEVFLAGGIYIDPFVSFGLLSSVEHITFADDTAASISVSTLAFPLSQARAEIGCNVVGRGRDLVMFAGGRFQGRFHEASDTVDILNVTSKTFTKTRLSHTASGVTVASVGALVMVTGGAPTFGPPQQGTPQGSFNYGAYENLGVDRYDVDTGVWQYLPYVLLENVDGGQFAFERVPVAFAGRFIAVVAGLTTVLQEGQNRSLSPIDLYDSFTGEWHRNVLQHHAGSDFLVAGVGDNLVVAGGVRSPTQFDVLFDTVTVFKWEPYAYELIECTNSATCAECTGEHTQRHYNPCRWCSTLAGAGQCIVNTTVCPPTLPVTLLAGQSALCGTAAPTPVPRVRYFRRHRVVLERDFATWDFAAGFRAELAAHLGCEPLALVEFAEPRNGSVIAFIQHSEDMTTNTAQYDAAYATLVGAPNLNVTSLTLLTQDYTVPPTPAPATPAPASTAAPATTAAPASSGAIAPPTPTEDNTNLYIGVGVAAAILLCLLLAAGVYWLMRRNARAVADARHDAELAGSTARAAAHQQYEMVAASESARNVMTVSGTGQIEEKYLILPRDIEKGNKLGEGAFGVVYKGRWRNIDVAIKEIKYEAMSDPAQIEAFEQEAVKMSRMRPHQNVVTLYGCVPSPLSIVVEFCPQGALDDWLRSPDGLAAPTSRLLKIVNGIAKGVAHLHAEGIIHRDLAARNILLSDGLLPKVADFGMSRNNQGEDSNQTRSNVGPLKWMAPEQLLKQQYSRASDVFAFGVVIYETMSGREPWEGLVNTAACHKVLNGERLPVPARAPAPLGELMRLCFETAPDMRPTMDDACRRLDRIVAAAGDDDDVNASSRKYTGASGGGGATMPVPASARTIAQTNKTDYDEPDVSDKLSTYNAVPAGKYDETPSHSSARPLQLSEAYSLAPDPRDLNAAGNYEAAPNITDDSRRQLDASAAANNTLHTDSAYDEPNIAANTVAKPAVAPAVAKLTEKDQARLWRLSKKYEPKTEPPPAAAAGTGSISGTTASELGRGTTVPITGTSDDLGPLPEGWRSAISPKSGRIYFYKKGSKETRWDRPTEP